jgi:serine/threonine protein kinase
MSQKVEYHANDLVAGKYRILKKIGTGGMDSTIYLAQDSSIPDNEYFSSKNKYVAIKVINRDKNITDDD